MISAEGERLYPAIKTLVKDCVASRVHAKDASLYDFDEQAQECAANFMGWADLASNPPIPLSWIERFADECHEQGFEDVVLIAQGGSSVAAMTIAKYCPPDAGMRFHAIDSDSPVRLREVLVHLNLAHTLVLVSSKSGGTIEIRSLLAVIRRIFEEELPDGDFAKHAVAITDPGSPLEGTARDESWLGVFSGEPTVGGRFSALSVFGLLPAALVGVDLEEFLAHALDAEQQCSEDSVDNPAIALAAFLYDNYLNDRDKVVLLMQNRARVLGLWIEQLVAESLGKNGEGILPNIEVDTLLLSEDPGDRTAVVYQTHNDLWDERKNFEMGLSYVDPAIPRLSYRIDTVEELAEHFVLWEYAVAMCGYLMRVCPFDQPDVAQAKANVLKILESGLPEPNFVQAGLGDISLGQIAVRLAPCFEGCDTVFDALHELFASIDLGDYFCLNAFLPFTGEGRREALERIRHAVAARTGAASCLEIGPRFLHSSGQLYKGGPNTGVFLVVSADEIGDVPIQGEAAESLGKLAEAQAVGDALTLADRGRRMVHLHLPDNAGVTLRCLADTVEDALAEIEDDFSFDDDPESGTAAD